MARAFVARFQACSAVVRTSSFTPWRNTRWTVLVLGILLAWILWQASHRVVYSPDLLTELQAVLVGPACWIAHHVVSKVIAWVSARARYSEDGPEAGAAESEPPGAAGAQKAPGGDEELAGRATPAGVFRTWVGKTPAERESLERIHLYLEQEMEDEERSCARLRKTTWVSGVGDEEAFEWTSPAGIGEAYDWSTRVQALLAQDRSPPPPQVLELASRSGARAPKEGSDVSSQEAVVTAWQGTRVLRQPEVNVSSSPDYRVIPSEKGGAPPRYHSAGGRKHQETQHQPTRRSQRLLDKQTPIDEAAQIRRTIYVLGKLPPADLPAWEQLLQAFHSDESMQDLVEIVLRNAQSYLAWQNSHGRGYAAARNIPKSTRFCYYSGALVRQGFAAWSNHRILLGKDFGGFTYSIEIDGCSTDNEIADGTTPGLLQMANLRLHRCGPGGFIGKRVRRAVRCRWESNPASPPSRTAVMGAVGWVQDADIGRHGV